MRLITPTLLLLALLCAPFSTHAQESLDPAEQTHWSSRGLLPLLDAHQDGTYAPARYLLLHDIVIDSGKVMTFEGGSDVRALRNARIIVKGRLVCDGSRAAPVSFSSLSAAEYYIPVSGSETPRWDGIVVEPGGELLLRQVKLQGARQGVEAKAGFERMWLDSVTFADIAGARVVVAGRMIATKEVTPFTYRTSGLETASGVPASRARWKLPARISLAGLAVAGAGLAIAGQISADDYQRKVDQASTSAKADDYAHSGDAMYGLRNAGIVVGLLGAAGCAVTFFF